MYEVLIDRSVEKDLEKMHKNVNRVIIRALEKLTVDPKPNGVKKLHGSNEDLYRIRVGDYRIIYSIAEQVKIVNIRRIRHRKEVYRNL
jgi:mRNA interferase RelE/StbE